MNESAMGGLCWREVDLAAMLVQCPVCGVGLHSTQVNGEFWYFHGAAVSTPSMVLSGAVARRAVAGEKLGITQRLQAWCKLYHQTIGLPSIVRLGERAATGRWE